MLYSHLLVERLFTPSQISQLQDIYNSATIEYLNDLQDNPFLDNLSGDSLFEKVIEFLPEVNFTKSDAKELISHLQYYFL